MHIHILGICGTFMGGLAALAREAGHRVTGCDAGVYPPMSEQLRPTGKLLLADKVLVVAREAGARRLDDPAWAQDFARAASAALATPVVRIDLAAMTVSY